MTLGELMKSYPVLALGGRTDIPIANIVYDSRRVRLGSLFVAIRGQSQDAHAYLEQAIRQGAVALIVSDPTVLETLSLSDYPELGIAQVDDSRDALAYVSAVFFGHPSTQVKLLACTGTHGRHTLAGMIYALWQQERPAIAYMDGMQTKTPLGTIYGGRNHPEAPDIEANLADLSDRGIDAAVMPLSKQDMYMKRVAHLHMEATILMHALDWDCHAWQQMAEQSRHLIVNFDDPAILHQFKRADYVKKDRPYISFGIDSMADFRATNLHIEEREGRLGTAFTLEIHGKPSYFVFVGLPGRYQVLNSLAALSVISLSQMSISAAVEGLRDISIPGRSEPVANDLGLSIYIDSSWTAGRMENLLTGLRPYCRGRLQVVLGSGGDRASDPRGDLAETAGLLADYSYLTVTNERSEGAESILLDLERGIRNVTTAYSVYPRREDAIEAAILGMEAGDLLVISGKGSETYNISAEETVWYSDRTVAEAALAKRSRRSHTEDQQEQTEDKGGQ